MRQRMLRLDIHQDVFSTNRDVEDKLESWSGRHSDAVIAHAATDVKTSSTNCANAHFGAVYNSLSIELSEGN